jgi:hypothetical protein
MVFFALEVLKYCKSKPTAMLVVLSKKVFVKIILVLEYSSLIHLFIIIFP